MTRELIELKRLFKLHGSYDKARYFCTLIIQELEERDNFLMPEEAASFGAYYGNIDRKSDAMRNHFALGMLSGPSTWSAKLLRV